MKHTSMVVTLVLWALGPGAAQANNATCWGMGKVDDPTRPDISCENLTEPFLLSLMGASRADVQKAMNAPGRLIPASGDSGGLQFNGFAGKGRGWDGRIDFKFDSNSRVYLIDAVIDGPNRHPSNMQFFWNSFVGGFCSDFPGSRKRCR